MTKPPENAAGHVPTADELERCRRWLVARYLADPTPDEFRLFAFP